MMAAATSPRDFIDLISPAAQASMKRSRIPASVIVAQAALESGWGTSLLATRGKNLFGIKAGPSWTGPVVEMPTWEVIDGKRVQETARFRSYADWHGSIDDHATFLLTNKRYRSAFDHADNAEAFARMIAAAGYATDPAYAEKLTGIIRRYDLLELDQTQAEPPVAVPVGAPSPASDAPPPAPVTVRLEPLPDSPFDPSFDPARPHQSPQETRSPAGGRQTPADDRSPPGGPIPAPRRPSIDGGAMPLPIPALIALGAELLKIIPWGRKNADKVNDVAPVLVEIARAVVPDARNEQEAVQRVLQDGKAKADFVAQVAQKWDDVAPFLEHEAKERAAARDFAEQMTSNGPMWRAVGFGATLSVLALLVLMGGGWMLREFLITAGADSQTKGMIIGFLIAAATQVLSYFFGSSASSRSKDQALGDAARNRG